MRASALVVDRDLMDINSKGCYTNTGAGILSSAFLSELIITPWFTRVTHTNLLENASGLLATEVWWEAR
jgi:hypothetical protein